MIEQLLKCYPLLSIEQTKQARKIYESWGKSSCKRYCEQCSLEMQEVVLPVKRKEKDMRTLKGNDRFWTKEQELFLKENWGKKTLEEISSTISKKPGSVIAKANRMGLRNKRYVRWTKEEINCLLTTQDTSALNRSNAAIKTQRSKKRSPSTKNILSHQFD